LILRKIIKVVSTRCQILTLKCTKIDFGWGSAPDPAGGAHSAPPDSIAGFKGSTSNGRGGEVSGRDGRGGERLGACPVCLLVLTILPTGLAIERCDVERIAGGSNRDAVCYSRAGVDAQGLMERRTNNTQRPRRN